MTEKPVALEFLIELEFRNVDFLWREELRKTLGARMKTNNKLTYDTGSRTHTMKTLYTRYIDILVSSNKLSLEGYLLKIAMAAD